MSELQDLCDNGDQEAMSLSDSAAVEQLFYQDQYGTTAIMRACQHLTPLELFQLMLKMVKLDPNRCMLVIASMYETAHHFAAAWHTDPSRWRAWVSTRWRCAQPVAAATLPYRSPPSTTTPPRSPHSSPTPPTRSPPATSLPSPPASTATRTPSAASPRSPTPPSYAAPIAFLLGMQHLGEPNSVVPAARVNSLFAPVSTWDSRTT